MVVRRKGKPKFLPRIVGQGIKGEIQPPPVFPIRLDMAVNFLYWNVRGIGKTPTLPRLKHLVKLDKISFIAPMLAVEKCTFSPRGANFDLVLPTLIALSGFFAKAAY